MISSQFTVHSSRITDNREQITENGQLITENKFGFTLVEMLVVVGIISVVAAMTTAFLTQTFKGSNKAQVTAEVKQNGEQVLATIERHIRNAREITSPNPGDPPSDTLNLILNDSSTVSIFCDNTGGPGVNNKIQLDNGVTTNALTNTNPKTGVSVTCNGGLFEVLPKTYDDVPTVVKVTLIIDQGVSAPSRADFTANVQLSTTVSLRTY